jgi:malate dehydrogenase (oxaloacetate-decarboxylating)
MVAAGLTDAQARDRMYLLDSRGLLMDDRKLEDYKQPFAQPAAKVAGWGDAGKVPDLLETVQKAKATVLLGLSGQPGAFTELVVRAMAQNCERPIIFPLSNPTSSSEAQPVNLIAWTDGRALVATGSPFPPVERGGKKFVFGQGNNAFVFPGLGAGAIHCGARQITDGMVMEAALAVADYTQAKHPGAIYPPVTELPEVSVRVAARVIAQAIKEGVAETPPAAGEDLEAFVRARFWKARYLPCTKA